MTRKFLQGLALESDVIDKIMQAHGDGIEREKSVAESLRDDIKKINADLATARGDLEKAKQDATNDDWESKYNAEVTAHGETKTAMQKSIDDEKSAHTATKEVYSAEKTASEIDSLVGELLKKADDKGISMNAAAIPKALKLYDRAIVKRNKDGAIENADKVLEYFKGEWGDFFAGTEQKGADVGNPPGGNGKDTDPFLAGFER